ncbi:hypothetical protein GCM10009584_18450 [Ornithinimicrobium humiphilum]|uniref:ABC-2 family transporter n=1 Tax=Ornithinimicrobium humiphilum TaxID=125288 RepID=A0A543KLL1_9MICO|nr:hypothetical protein [Ornithinimicrobium humiphilum]TQM95934.1 hypothetical protein FB476_0785 [Ornithinimicrobium humiphilum]
MTTTEIPTARTPGAVPQWRAVGRLLTAEALTNLLFTTGVLLGVSGLAALMSWWRGWRLQLDADVDGFLVGFTADGVGAPLISWLLLVAIGVALSGIANVVVLACRTRVLVVAGATRRSIALGLLLTTAATALWSLLVAAVVLLVVGGGVDGAASLVGADGAGGLALAGLAGLGSYAMLTMLSLLVVALFLRWPWWVGVSALVLVWGLVPLAIALTRPGLAAALDELGDRGATGYAVALVAAALAWLVVRRAPVR